MRKIVVLAVVMLLAVSMGAAWAGEIQGTVKSVDSSSRALVLEDGTELRIAEGLNIEAVKEGSKVKAMFEEREGKNVVTDLQVAD